MIKRLNELSFEDAEEYDGKAAKLACLANNSFVK